MELEKLIVLQYQEGKVVQTPYTGPIEGLTIDIAAKRWSFRSSQRTEIGYPHVIRDHATGKRVKEGVIGVYNRAITRHMENMNRDMQSAAE